MPLIGLLYADVFDGYTLYTTDNEINIFLSGYNEYYINSVDIHENLSDRSEDISAHNFHYGMNLVSFSVLPEDYNVNNVLSSKETSRHI